jgi:hypothetical protein
MDEDDFLAKNISHDGSDDIDDEDESSSMDEDD